MIPILGLPQVKGLDLFFDPRLEARWIDGEADRPVILMLHEGLGSVSLWRDFPDQVAARTGSPVLEELGSLAAKGVDLIVANDVAEPGSGFGTDTNRVTIVVPGAAPEPWPQLTKAEVADRLLDRVLALRS